MSPKLLICSILALVSAGNVMATTCGPISAEEADYYATQRLIYFSIKGILAFASLLVTVIGGIRLLKQAHGWIIITCIALLAIPVALIFLIAELMSMVCESYGISPWYYVGLLIVSVLVFGLTRGFAPSGPGRLDL